LLGKRLFVWGEFAGSATARLIMQTLDAMLFPFLNPGRHGDAMDLIGLSKGLDGRPCSTQQQTMGATPSAEGGILVHGLF
jgi:hypothetical protein